ncbi:fibronectin type III domain-containing protein [Candidatus Uhrbacteria bacterium]|nr:fibronectin type III domain-containing protein [Candidatus Uhrbacteria bacterium]
MKRLNEQKPEREGRSFFELWPMVPIVMILLAVTWISGVYFVQAATLVQSAEGTKLSNQGTPTSVTATFTSAAVAGRMLIAVVGTNGYTTITGPSGWSTAINQAGTASQGIFYKRAAGGETAVTATVSSNPGSVGMHIYEYSGATTFEAAGSSFGTSTTPGSGSVVTSQANELVFAAFVIRANTNYTDTSWNNGGEGFAERRDFSTSGAGRLATYGGGDNLANTAGSKSVTVAAGSSAGWRGQVVRFTNDTTAPAAVSNLAAASPTVSSTRLTWTSPGDDGSSGTASSYDIRYSTSLITDANFGSATQVAGEPTPVVAGTSQSMTVSGLSANTTYYFAMKAADEVPNWSGLSNVPSRSTLATTDSTPPDAVSNLALSNPTLSSIDLAWTAPGDDDGTGTAESYDVRYSMSPITSDADFAAASEASGEPTPSLAGTPETMTVTGLSPNTNYYFAIKTSDEVPNISDLSNTPNLSTLAAPDAIPPDPVDDLAASNPALTSIDLTWTATGDDGVTGTASAYDIRYSTSPILSDSDFAAATPVVGEPVPAGAGAGQSMTVSGLVSNRHYYFVMVVADESLNVSDRSNTAELSTLAAADTIAPAAITDLTLSNPTPFSIDLAWTAPGDDGDTGTAAFYDVHYSTSPIVSDADFDSAHHASGEPVPGSAGTPQSMTVTGLDANTRYYFIVRTSDEAPNESALSNNPHLSTLVSPDTTPPAAVANLSLTGPSASGMTVSWMAPGDDGTIGQASLYDIRYSTSPISSDGDFNAAVLVDGEPLPQTAGAAQSMVVSGLSSNTYYYFAMKTKDDVPNTSGLSNVPGLSTLSAAPGGEPDTVPEEVHVLFFPEVCTTDPHVKLLVHAHNATAVRFGTTADLEGVAWQDYSVGMDRTAVYPWTLSGEDGPKIAYVGFRSLAGVESEVESVSILLDRTTNCHAAEGHEHIVVDGEIEAVESSPACLADFIHAEIEPYLVDRNGKSIGWQDESVVHVTRLSEIEVQYAFEVTGNATFDDIVVHVERFGRQTTVHLDSAIRTDDYRVHLRIDAADRKTLMDEMVWDLSNGKDFEAKSINLETYPELCESSLVPHAHFLDLFKSPTSDVYFMGGDGKRHAFPSQAVFDSWFPNGADITIVPRYQLADIPLGENVTFRPGTLVRIIDGVRYYVVDFGKRLRFIASDILLPFIFGNTWQASVRLLDLAIAGDYTFGTSIEVTQDLQTILDRSATSSIDMLAPVGQLQSETVLGNVIDGRIVVEGEPYTKGSAEIRFKILAKDGHAFSSADLQGAHGAAVHLIIARDDMSVLQHLHPIEHDGVWSVSTVIPSDGRYYAYADIVPVGEPAIILRAPLLVGEDLLPGEAFPEPTPMLSVADGDYRVTMSPLKLVAGKSLPVTFTVTKDGKPFDDVRANHGEEGHLVILKQHEPNFYVHTHPDEKVSANQGELQFHLLFPTPGRYTNFLLLDLGGKIHTVSITTEISESRP